MQKILPLLLVCTLLFSACHLVPATEDPSDSVSDKDTQDLPDTHPDSDSAATVEETEPVPSDTLPSDSGTPGLAYVPGYADGTCTILGLGSAAQSEIVIPATIDGLRVTAIARDAFADCTGIVRITLPQTLLSIGSDAFRGCSSLTEIRIPATVQSIGIGAFVGCASLQGAHLAIPDGWFAGGTQIEGLNDPENAAAQLRLLSYAEWTKGETVITDPISTSSPETTVPVTEATTDQAA